MSFFAVEQAMVDRIRAIAVPGLKVLTAPELAGLKKASQPVPAVHVIPDGWTIGEKGGVAEITERWLTVVVVRNVRNAATGEDARAENEHGIAMP
jgi:hypothetical protein